MGDGGRVHVMAGGLVAIHVRVGSLSGVRRYNLSAVHGMEWWWHCMV